MSIPTDISATPEHDSHSDSDWLDITSTDRDSDDNDSIYSSRETDHEDLSRSRSRRSSLSYGSSREGDVDAWEGLIDDSADEGMPSDVLAPSRHVLALSQRSATFDPNFAQETSPEDLRVKEGLDQSMISTLSSSRSSSVHASTVHSSSRDLRLSFPDPITSSCRELLSTSYEEIQRSSEILSSPTDAGVTSDAYQVDDEDLLSASQTLSTELQTSAVLSSGPELKVHLYGFPTVHKWSIVDRLFQKATHGAGLTITPGDLLNSLGSIRRLVVSGSFEHDHAFPRIITIYDRTLEPLNAIDDPAFVDCSGARSLAIILLPCLPLHLPEQVLLLPVQTSSSYRSDAGMSSRGTWNMHSVPNHQVLRVTAPEDPPVLDEDSIDTIDSTRVYHAFSRLWTSDHNTSKGLTAGTHALTIIAILSLILGVVVRAAIPISQHQLISPALSGLNHNYTSGCLWQILRPTPYRERLPPSTTLDSSVAAIPSTFKEFSLSVFSTESRANPTNFRRVVSSAMSEHAMYSGKDVILQPPHSVLPLDNRPKALSVVSETTPTASHSPSPVTTVHSVSSLVHTSLPEVVKEELVSAASFAIVNRDMQDIFDALDALVQAITRQTRIILSQATTFIEQSAMELKSVESIEMIKEKLYVHNEHARKRAKEMKEIGTKWLQDASEAITTGAQFTKGVAWEMAEGLAHRAQHARGKAREMATEIQVFVNEYERLEAFVWDAQAQYWCEWVERVSQGDDGKRCKASKRRFESVIFY